MGSPRQSNRLANETSPYLLQHAENPVAWQPWDEQALRQARQEDKPILLSIGYAACHWCHVMEHESFESDDVARLMNERFVCIKVDREERPDLDDIYMTAVQMMTGHGGWPLNVFLTPELEPFWGGTYFPPEDRMGMPGFKTVLRSLARAWREDRDRIETMAGDLSDRIRQGVRPEPSLELLDRQLIDAAVRTLGTRFDSRWGGFSGAPKFPHSASVSLLLRVAHRRDDDGTLHMATHTLDRMACGGLRDHLGGGFHRYSTDERWLVPHFEKMLYDNALLAQAYLEAYQLTGDQRHARVASETLAWVARDMQGGHGGYFSTLDADSEGVEGKFYVWSRAEVEELLGDEAEAFCRVYDIREGGNWEGKNIPHLERPLEEALAELATAVRASPRQLEASLQRSRRKLLETRERRVPPGLDDKVLTDWNGMMIAAMARGHRVLGDERWKDSAVRAARFLLDEMFRDGRLLHAHREGESKLLAYLDDHAWLISGLVELWESTFDLDWLEAARSLADRMIGLFWDDDDGGFFFVGADHEELLARMKPGNDGATPSGNAVAATVLQRLATWTGEDAYRRRAVEVMRAFQHQMKRAPSAFAQMLIALDRWLADPREVAVVGDSGDEATRQALDRLWSCYAPDHVVGLLDTGPDGAEGRGDRRVPVERAVPLLAGKKPLEGEVTYYVCENYTCQAPTTDLEEAVDAFCA